MSYEEEFYTPENIIGYTGDFQVNPTVYFKNGNKFGRITQTHADNDNIGRSLVREYTDYRIGNTAPSGTAEEYYDGEVQHVSRHPFVAAQEHSHGKTVLAASILAHTEAKTTYRKVDN